MLNKLNFVNCTITTLMATFISLATTIATKAEETKVNNTDSQETNSEINFDGLDIWSTIVDEKTTISVTKSCFDFEPNSRDKLINSAPPKEPLQDPFLSRSEWEIYKKPIFLERKKINYKAK